MWATIVAFPSRARKGRAPMTIRDRRACIICGDPRIHARRRCKTDYQYLRRNGVDRPLELVIRLTDRDITRELTRAIAAE